MAEEDEISTALIADLYKPPALLPIAQLRQALLYTIETYPVTIIVGETGSGKTTQIPQFLYQGGWNNDGTQIAITQPRRIAATSVATRVAEEMGCELGQEVGYSIRFEDFTTSKTKIKFLTDGLLLREMLVDPMLSRYSVIMVDEAHERSLSSDMLLSVLKKVLKKRPDLRIVISSATLNAEKFLHFFAPEEGEKLNGLTKEEYGYIISIEGRAYPVGVQYLAEPAPNYVERAVDAVMDIHKSEDAGDILVFLTGRDEIDDAIEMVSERVADLGGDYQNLQSLPLYAGLTTDQQMYVFQKAEERKRKVIFSTNIAEASVTIDGIVYVVDCGYVKIRHYNPDIGIEHLSIVPISKASATQRAGRAGRTRAGTVFRLYTEAAFNSMEEESYPEVQRSNLAPVILQLMNLGITNIIRFDYFANPPSKLVIRALDLLVSLGAIDHEGRLTKPLGLRMAELPLEPMLAKALLNSVTFSCVSEMLTIAAMLTLQGSAFVYHDGSTKVTDRAKRQFSVLEGDHITLFNVFSAFEQSNQDAGFCRENYLNYKALLKAASVRRQLKAQLARYGIEEDSPAMMRAGGMNAMDVAERVRRCLTTGFFAHAAKMKADGTFIVPSGSIILHPHPSSMFFHRRTEWVIYHEILETKDKVYIRDLTPIDMDWLTEYAPEYWKVKGKT
ncbi:P-loop containing nucleoside triphosphate hydrolase protein [Corynespora cassiicola Philippines]|uniref:RNA helicase n=1 Tax=Corynespora cassiicola Philippines TaxID=1448308 RepID=A0A2T2N943_CORCC|nr:P-loop containing nucleoside triphosphate hydrolase protein [Corynespora cassiicola Philippines]